MFAERAEVVRMATVGLESQLSDSEQRVATDRKLFQDQLPQRQEAEEMAVAKTRDADAQVDSSSR